MVLLFYFIGYKDAEKLNNLLKVTNISVNWNFNVDALLHSLTILSTDKHF